MNVIKVIESLIRIREELEETKKKIEYLRRELDAQTGDLIEFLKDRRIIETRTV
jgi:dsDNA-specific endonuclease/ATPase MutS2